MNHRERFLHAAVELGVPEDEATAFAGFLRFAIWTSPHNTGPVVGQMGGLPRLPEGMPWPSSESLPVPFIASFDCAALPRVDDLPLPADGSLLLFLHHDLALEEREDTDSEMGSARVVYVPAGTPTVTAQEPDHPEEPFYNSTLSFIGDEQPLIAEVNAELPSWLRSADVATRAASGSGDHLGLHLPHREELRLLAGKLWPESAGASVRLGGYTGGIGALATDHMYATPETDMAEQKLEARKRAGDIVIRPGERDAYLERETLRVMREWLPLAQFVPEEVHRGRFLIRRDDLAAGRFDEALSFTAFTE